MLLNKILLCFVQPLNLKVYRSHYEFFDGEFLVGAMYCMVQKMTKLRVTSRLKLQMCFTGLKRSFTCVVLETRENPAPQAFTSNKLTSPPPAGLTLLRHFFKQQVSQYRFRSAVAYQFSGPLVYISGIHNTISDLTFFLHRLVYVIKVCVYSSTTPPNFFENYNSRDTSNNSFHCHSIDNFLSFNHSGISILIRGNTALLQLLKTTDIHRSGTEQCWIFTESRSHCQPPTLG